jgi:hypothetical protein
MYTKKCIWEAVFYTPSKNELFCPKNGKVSMELSSNEWDGKFSLLLKKCPQKFTKNVYENSSKKCPRKFLQ